MNHSVLTKWSIYEEVFPSGAFMIKCAKEHLGLDLAAFVLCDWRLVTAPL